MVSSTSAAVAPRRGGRWVGLLVTVAVILAGCVGQAPTVPSQQASTLVVGATLEPPTMNPSASPAASIPQLLLYNVYETLVKMDAEGNLKPLLAQAWDVSDDRTVYTFRLNPAARFAGGKPVTAQAVVTSFNRIKTETISAPLVEQMAVVKSTEAVDDGTVRVTLSRPSNLWLYDISSTAGIIYDPEGLSTLDTEPAGSGPFVLEKWNKGQSVVLASNSGYWGTAPRLDHVTFRYFADPNAMNAAMLSGDLDIISNLQAPDAIGQFGDTSRYSVIEGTTTGEVVMALNNARSSLKDARVRRAISLAIDKRALVDTVWNGKGTLIGSMAVPTDPWYEDLTAINAYDQAKAKDLLAEAKATNLNLKLRVPTIAYATKSAQFVESSLRQVGIKVTVEELDFATWLNDVHNGGNYDMSIVAHVEARDLRRFTDPEYYFHYDNADFNDAFEAADDGPTAQLVPLMRKAVRILADDAAAVWLFDLPNLVITKSTVTGVAQNSATLSFDLTTISTR